MPIFFSVVWLMERGSRDDRKTSQHCRGGAVLASCRLLVAVAVEAKLVVIPGWRHDNESYGGGTFKQGGESLTKTR